MLVMGKANAEFRNKFSALQFWIRDIAETWKQPTRGVFRSDCDVAVRTNDWRGAFAREELRAMTIQTRRVFGKIGDVLKSRVGFAHDVPILRRNFMTGIAG